MHNAALAELGLDWVYLALPVASAQLGTVLQALEAIDCRGLNVTLPHKQAVARLVSERSPLAERLGAVNTLVRRAAGGWIGTNTDVEGFLAPLQLGGQNRLGQDALVLGCGGSARAVLAGLVELGCGRIRVSARRPEALNPFLQACRPWAPGLEGLLWREPTDLVPALEAAALVVNTTPVGMASTSDPAAADRSPLPPELVAALNTDCTVYDLIYTPRPTALLRLAAARGCRTLDGLEMLVQQGAAALRLWSGLEQVPVAAMRRAALESLGAP